MRYVSFFWTLRVQQAFFCYIRSTRISLEIQEAVYWPLFYLETFMILKIVIILYLVVLLLTAFYLWHNRDRHFLVFSSKSNTNFRPIMSWTAIILLLECIIGIIILFQSNKYLNLVTILLSSITILIFSLLINHEND